MNNKEGTRDDVDRSTVKEEEEAGIPTQSKVTTDTGNATDIWNSG